jgi:hypothetical protein
MQGHYSPTRLFAAIGTVAMLALGFSAPGSARERISWSSKTDPPAAHPALKRAAVLQLISLGYGPCGELEVFVPITNGRRGIPMC